MPRPSSWRSRTRSSGSPQARYDHRRHGLLLVAQGISCGQVGQLLGDAPRTVAYWVHRFEAEGLAGLVDGERPGRPPRLDDQQLAKIDAALRKTPREHGLSGSMGA